jgi:hypothetical protein
VVNGVAIFPQLAHKNNMYQQTVKIKKLRDEFPFEQQPRLQDKFPFSRRSPAVGSGFLNTASIIYNTPIIPVPEPRFRLMYGNVTFESANNFDAIVAGRGPFDIENITNSSTYTSSSWSISDGVTTLTGNNNNGFMIPRYSGSDILTFDITLTLYFKDVSASANMRIIAHPASIDYEIINQTVSTDVNQGESVLHILQNTTLGNYDSMRWTSSNPLLVFDDDTYGTVNATFSPGLNEPPVIITLRLYVLNDVVGEVTKTLEYNVIPSIPVVSINGTETDTITAFGAVDEGDIITFDFLNTSLPPGNYDEIVWTYSGLNDVFFSEPIDPLSFVDPNDPNQHLKISTNYVVAYPAPQIITVTLALKWNGVIVNSVTLTTIFNNITPLIPAINGISTGTILDTDLTKFEGETTPFTFTNTTLGNLNNTSFVWSSSGVSFSPNNVSPLNATIKVPYSFGSENTYTLPTITLTVTKFSLVKTLTLTLAMTINLKYDSVIMQNAAALLDLVQPSVTGEGITIALKSAPYIGPTPQINTTSYSGIQMLWVATTAGAPAVEPTKFRIQTTTESVLIFRAKHVQGRNVDKPRVMLSLDTSLSPPSGETVSLNNQLGSSSLTDNTVLGVQWTQYSNKTNVLQRLLYSINTFLRINQPPGTLRNYDNCEISVNMQATKSYNTAYQLYLSNNQGLTSAQILSNTSYFGSNTGRFRLTLENNATVTFQLPVGASKYVALITGALTVNTETTPIYGTLGGSQYASTFDITPKVNVTTGHVSFSKVPTLQGSVIGFFSFFNLFEDGLQPATFINVQNNGIISAAQAQTTNYIVETTNEWQNSLGQWVQSS